MIDHYEQPRNVGKLDGKKKNVGTGLVGAPACGDVMKLQVNLWIWKDKVQRKTWVSSLTNFLQASTQLFIPPVCGIKTWFFFQESLSLKT